MNVKIHISLWFPGAGDVIGKAVCIKDGEAMQEKKIPGIEQLALGVSCKEPDLDVCILRTLSQDKEISGIKLACCNCGNSDQKFFI